MIIKEIKKKNEPQRLLNGPLWYYIQPYSLKCFVFFIAFIYEILILKKAYLTKTRE